MNTTDLLTIACSIVPERVAIVFEKQRFTYRQLQHRVNLLANAMADMGVRSGDRVAIMHVNCNEVIETYFAAAKLDAIFVPLNFRSRADEMAQMITTAEPSILIVGNRYLAVAEDALSNAPQPKHVIVLEGESHCKWLSYDDLLAVASSEEQHSPKDQDQSVTLLMFTSGTTGVPKAVMLTHSSFISYLLDHVNPADPELEERNILSVPLYHIAGMQGVLAGVYGGRTLVIMRQFDPLRWMELVQGEVVTKAMMVPTMIKQLIEHPQFHDYDLSSLEALTYGAAPMPLEVIKSAINAFPTTHFINAFGQTETAATITMLSPEDHNLVGTEDEIEVKLKRLSSVGLPLNDVELRIVDEKHRDVTVGAVGEIIARGPRVMKGYWNHSDSTESVVREGWLHTGDSGYQDSDGYIYLTGRVRDVIKRGGELISAEEVERVLMSHMDVYEVAVIGVPDLEWGELVRAVVVKLGNTTTEEELMGYCRQKLSSFKCPQSIVFVDNLPRNSMGKVLKWKLREVYGPVD